MVVLMTLAVPAFNAIRGGTDFTGEVYNMAGMLDEARAYAMANHTYALAGIVEVSSAQDSSASPQISGTGRIAMAIIASKNGTRPYQSLLPNSLSSWQSPSPGVYGTGSAFIPVTALITFPNLHLVDLQYNGLSSIAPPSSGNMARPALGTNGYYYDLSNAGGSSSTLFAWPLGQTLAGPSQYVFSKVIEYDPEGSARIISTANSASYPQAVPLWIEIGVEPSHGSSASGPPAGQNSGEIAAIQINGISGASHIYRP